MSQSKFETILHSNGAEVFTHVLPARLFLNGSDSAIRDLHSDILSVKTDILLDLLNDTPEASIKAIKLFLKDHPNENL